MILQTAEYRCTIEKVHKLPKFQKYNDSANRIWVTFTNIEGLEIDSVSLDNLQGYSFHLTTKNSLKNNLSGIIHIDIRHGTYLEEIGKGIFRVTSEKNKLIQFECKILQISDIKIVQQSVLLILGIKYREDYQQIGYHHEIDLQSQQIQDERVLKNLKIKRRRLYTLQSHSQNCQSKQSCILPNKLFLKNIQFQKTYRGQSKRGFYPKLLEPACFSVKNKIDQQDKNEGNKSLNRKIYSFSAIKHEQNGLEIKKRILLNAQPKNRSPKKIKKMKNPAKLITIDKIYFEQSQNFLRQSQKTPKSNILSTPQKKYVQVFLTDEIIYESNAASGKQPFFWILKNCNFLMTCLDEMKFRIFDKKGKLINYFGSTMISYNQFIANSQYTNQIQRFIMQDEEFIGVLSVFFQINQNQELDRLSQQQIFNQEKFKFARINNKNSYCPFHYQSPSSVFKEKIKEQLGKKEKLYKKKVKKIFPTSDNQFTNLLIRNSSMQAKTDHL